ncbi:MAG TPA: FHA domain-containing protein [Planctomycetota bacterium]|nr:FHA domain-containing protein [Planctomycetota bacterium]
MARLILESGGERKEIRIRGAVTIGRAPSADVSIDDRTLSREHTRVYGENGRYFVRDLESKNGTYLNGELIRRPEALKPGDRIRIGPATFVFAADPDDPPPPSAPVPATEGRPSAAPAPAPRPRPRAESGAAADAAAAILARIALFGIAAATAWFSKDFFARLLERIPT